MLLACTAFRVHTDSAFCARVRAAYEAGPSAHTAAGTAGAGVASASASAVGAGASRNSALLHRVGAAGGTNSTGSGDARLMVRGRGAGPSH